MMARPPITSANTRPDTRLQTFRTVYRASSSLLAGGVHTGWLGFTKPSTNPGDGKPYYVNSQSGARPDNRECFEKSCVSGAGVFIRNSRSCGAYRHLLDTYGALIIIDLAIVLPYAIWTIKGFIDAIPIEVEEAAIVDGAGRFRVIWDIVVPMARPGILTAAIFCFIITWNEFLFGYLLSRQKVVPLPVGITGFILERGPVWELIAATGIIITIPMFFFALAIQRHFTKGMNLGAVR